MPPPQAFDGQSLIDGLPDGLLWLDAEGRVVAANARACEWLTRDRASLIGRALAEIARDEPALVATRTVIAALTSASEAARGATSGVFSIGVRRIAFEVVPWVGRDGHLVKLRVLASPLPAGPLDLSGEAPYRVVFGAMAEGVAIHGADCSILDCNASAERILGLTRDQIMGRTSLDPRWRTVREDGSAFLGEDHPSSTTLRTGRPQRGVVMGVQRPDGTVSWISINSEPVVLPGATPVLGVVATFTDITQLKKAEAERRELATRMFEAQRLESLGLLAGGLAHDFNNLLTGIFGFADRALESLPEGAPARLELANLVRSVHDASDLTRQILAFAGSGRVLLEPIDLALAIRTSCDLVTGAVAKSCTVRWVVPDTPIAVVADPAQIRQALLNLVVNGCDALGGRGGNLTVRVGTEERPPEKITVVAGAEVLPPGRYAFFEVEDGGEGMTRDVTKRAFEPFFSTKGPGRGLGLAAVAGIVRGHRGAIEVDSRPGTGTRIRVLLPAAVTTPTGNVAVPAPAGAWQGTGRVLVVEDELTLLHLLERRLQVAGFVVHTARDGVAALERFAEHRTEWILVVLDLTLPRASGECVLREIRVARPDLPVILTSGYVQEEVKLRDADRRHTRFLAKPYRMADLVEVARQLLETAVD